MPFQMGNQAPAPNVPGINKIPVSCHGYTGLQAPGSPWECPACLTRYNLPEPAPEPADAGD
jgi:hypothetical protein